MTIPNYFKLIFIILIVLNLKDSNILRAEDLTMLGGDLSSSLEGRAAIQVNAPNVTDEDRKNLQLSGFGIFHTLNSKETGLGPDYINASCGGCHIGNGKGFLKFTRNFPGSIPVVKVSQRGLNSDGSPIDVDKLGEQLKDHSIGKRNRIKIRIRWRILQGKYSDGTKYKLRKPILSFTVNKKVYRRVITSLRVPPAVIGPGLLEAIPDETLLALSDPDDENKDGISGHPNYVIDRRDNSYKIGRFGFRASHPTLEQQSAAAAFHDMGITNKDFNIEGEEVEMSDENLEKLVVYQKLAGVPLARDQSNPDVVAGQLHFKTIGCDNCHAITMSTQDYSDSELSNQTFHPFTDLLLHDMGRGLADKRAEFSASGKEWRTTPLWGLGYAKFLQDEGQKIVYLHDGRARSVEEAILWHGGEASRSQRLFKLLSKEARDQLLVFLDSL